MANFAEKSINNLAGLDEFRGRTWLFRGEKNYGATSASKKARSLETTLERFLRENNCELTTCNARKVEQTLLREFQRRYHHYSSSVPSSKLALEWLSIMRHHGSPTRLMDFTYSVYIAAYFAVEHDDGNNCCIWGINRDWCFKEAANKLEQRSLDGNWIEKPFESEKEEEKFSEYFFMDPPIDMVAPLNPFRLNQRITTQLGIFLCPGNVKKTFVENLEELSGWNKEENIVKLVIPRKYRQEFLVGLWEMNINRASLFPGLDGFAETLRVYHPIVAKVMRQIDS